MKKALFLFGLAIILTACNDSQDTSHIDNHGVSQVYAATIPQNYTYIQVEVSNETVYICTGPQSKRFHKTSSCRGLNSCSKEIKAMSIEQAKKIGRTPCSWCYK